MICNLALLTGKIGRPGCALMPLRGQNNVQGSSDMGALPDTFTMYRSVGDEETARMFEERWGVTMKRERGLKMPEMLDAAIEGTHQGDVDLRLRHRAVRPGRRPRRRGALEPRVPRRPGDLRERDLELRARRSSRPRRSSRSRARSRTPSGACRSCEAAASPPGAAKTDLEIFGLISARLGHELPYEGPEDVMDEIAELTPHFAGVTYERLGRRGLQWPVAADGTDSPILYEERVRAPRAAARTSRRCRTSRRATRRARSTRSSSSPAGGSSTTTSAR